MAENNMVSIIMPSYNSRRFLRETIESVLSQTYPSWELLFVDDCSVDDTEAILLSFKDPRIRYFKNEQNKGAAISRNLALREAKGRWIAFLDSDDIWLPKKLEHQIRFMSDNDYHFSYHEYNEIDEESRFLGVKVSGPRRIRKTGMFNYCWPGCLTVMYDANVVGLVQIEDIKKNNDYAMWLKVCRKVDCYLLSEELAYYRKHKGSISNCNKIELAKWHYYLYHNAEKQNVFLSLFNTLRNLCFGVVKRLLFVKKSHR